MTTTNLPLYQLLIKLGAAEEDAAAAATLDQAQLVTNADLAAALAELKADLTKTMVTMLLAMTVLFGAISAALRFVK